MVQDLKGIAQARLFSAHIGLIWCRIDTLIGWMLGTAFIVGFAWTLDIRIVLAMFLSDWQVRIPACNH